MNNNKDQIETNLRLHVDRLAGLIGVRTLRRPKTIQATIGYIEGQWAEMGYENTRETYDALGDEATNLIVEQTGTKRPEEIVYSAPTMIRFRQRPERTTMPLPLRSSSKLVAF